MVLNSKIKFSKAGEETVTLNNWNIAGKTRGVTVDNVRENISCRPTSNE